MGEPRDSVHKRDKDDPILVMLSTALRHHLLTDDSERPVLAPRPQNVEQVIVYSTGQMSLRYKVYTDQGVRTFNLRLTEDKHDNKP